MATKPYVSEPTLRRLPTYLHLLRGHHELGAERISCNQIGRELGLDPTQVRKDLAVAGNAGRPRVGFEVASLIEGIETFLGWNNVNEAFLAGAGNLGYALLGYDRLKDYGVHIVAAFDSDPRKVGTEVHGRMVLAIGRLAGLVRRMHVRIGIIAVPADQAQGVADRMVEGGVLAIWNFAPVTLQLPPHVIVQNEELYYSLAALSRKVSARLRNPRRKGGTKRDGHDGNPAADAVPAI